MSKSHACFCAYNRTMDLRTPRNLKLTAFFRRSFAFRTVRDRLPVILTKVIDSLSQNKEEIVKEYGEESSEDIKTVIGKLSRLKYEIQTNKPLKNIKSSAPDASIYNECIRERDGQEGIPTPFHTVWLLVECYMYRKIWEAIEKTKYLKEFDPFHFGKEELFHVAVPQIKETLTHLHKISQTPVADKEELFSLLEINLWSNKCDLSLNPEGVTPLLADQIRELSKNILINDAEKVWTTLLDTKSDTVDIVLDNVGMELFSDLCVAHYLTVKKLAKKVNFHVKNLPWFLSDVMERDIKWMLVQMKEHQNELMKFYGETWLKNFSALVWEIKKSDFWTLPVEMEWMHKYDRNLYTDLSKAKIIFFKGDLNYRKLFREIHWEPDTLVTKAQGNFAPGPFCSLRTCKSDIICGLPTGLSEEYDEKDPSWIENGNYGVIQFSNKIVELLPEKSVDEIIFAGEKEFRHTPYLNQEEDPKTLAS